MADPEGVIAEAYRVMARFRSTTKRVTYVIDRHRRIRGVFHHELRAKKHVDEVLSCLAALEA